MRVAAGRVPVLGAICLKRLVRGAVKAVVADLLKCLANLTEGVNALGNDGV